MVYHDVLIAFSILQWFFPGLLLMLEWVNHYNYNCALLMHKIFGNTMHFTCSYHSFLHKLFALIYIFGDKIKRFFSYYCFFLCVFL